MALAIFLFVLLDGVIRSRVDGVRLGAAWQQCELCYAEAGSTGPDMGSSDCRMNEWNELSARACVSALIGGCLGTEHAPF